MDTVNKTPVFAAANSDQKSGSQNYNHPSSNTPLLYPQPVYQVVYPQQQERARRRKVCARLGHFILLVLFVSLFGRPIHNFFSRHFHHSDHINMDFSVPQSGPNDCVDRASWNTEENNDGGHHHFRFVSHTSFELSRFSDLLYFVGRGSLAHGVFVLTDEGTPGSDNVGVDIDLWHNTEQVLEKIDVCTLEPEEDKIGVGIFTPNFPPHPRHEFRTEFRVTVNLPKTRDGKLQFFNDFQTDLPIFVHEIGDLKDALAFRAISLHTSNTPIRIKSLFAENISTHTSNSPIGGQVSATNELIIHTSNAPIDVDATIDNDGSSDASTVFLATSNSRIKSTITLTSSAKSGNGGTFDVTTTTSNGPLDISFPSAPVDSTLIYQGHSSNSPITVGLHKTYEGTFELDSSAWFRPDIKVDKDAVDPKGEGRHRAFEARLQRGHGDGKIWWAGNGNEGGNGVVKLRTSNSPIRLSA